MAKALGLIETVGLAAAIAALDTALKTADVMVLGIENSRGSGRQTVKIFGSVSAVQAATKAGAIAAQGISSVYAMNVIARPSDELEDFLLKESSLFAQQESSQSSLQDSAKGKMKDNRAVPQRKSGRKHNT